MEGSDYNPAGESVEMPVEELSEQQENEENTLVEDDAIDSSVLVAWGIIVATLLAFFWYQSMSYEAAQRKKKADAEAKAIWDEEQRELRKQQIEEMRRERLESEVQAKRAADEERAARAKDQLIKEEALQDAFRANVDNAQETLLKATEEKVLNEQQAAEEAQIKRALALSERTAAEEAAHLGQQAAATVRQASYDEKTALKPSKREGQPKDQVPALYDERQEDKLRRLESLKKKQLEFEAEASNKASAAKAAKQARASSAAVATTASATPDACINGWMQPGLLQAESDSDRALRLGQIENQEYRRVVQEQDAEFEAALQADRARDAAEEAARRFEHQANERRAQLKDHWQSLEEPAAGAPGVVDIAVRLPQGIRFQRRFDGNALLTDVFDWVDGQWAAPSGAQAVPFQLVTDYPRRVFTFNEAAEAEIKVEEFGSKTLFSAQFDD
ncbi:hypothetical protein CYMTET_40955 [Cymbomonas tetramitiformis]|uniref:UBX domain-containing protein n=1 Tax=Cymbomonas tetramitiformis TaxID=36881 RepID=A0AAE0C980_9CHLO|nr:hypothetical protein CYMTET_40955 [Cymbomonas tetramitiformis]